MKKLLLSLFFFILPFTFSSTIYAFEFNSIDFNAVDFNQKLVANNSYYYPNNQSNNQSNSQQSQRRRNSTDNQNQQNIYQNSNNNQQNSQEDDDGYDYDIYRAQPRYDDHYNIHSPVPRNQQGHPYYNTHAVPYDYNNYPNEDPKREEPPKVVSGLYVSPKLFFAFQNDDHVFFYSDSVFDADHTRKSSKSNPTGGAFAIGYDFGKNFNSGTRLEFEYSVINGVNQTKSAIYKDDGKHEFSSKEASMSTFFVNFYSDFKNPSTIAPYIVTGFGGAWSELDTGNALTIFGKNTSYAFNIGAGLNFEFTETFSFDFGYRYLLVGLDRTVERLVTGNSNIPSWLDSDNTHVDCFSIIHMHQIMLTMRVYF